MAGIFLKKKKRKNNIQLDYVPVNKLQALENT